MSQKFPPAPTRKPIPDVAGSREIGLNAGIAYHLPKNSHTAFLEGGRGKPFFGFKEWFPPLHSMDYILRSARFIAGDVFQQVIQPGDTVVDATMGNGHDTLTLCRLVGPAGKVYAFDVQPAAVENTRARLLEARIADRAELYCLGHEHILEKVEGPIALAVFNLGWLPGGDKSITTHWETTRQAVKGALSLLKPLGVCVICAYPGHAEGDREREYLMDLLAQLPPQQYNVLWHKFLNAGPGAPECFVIQRQ